MSKSNLEFEPFKTSDGLYNLKIIDIDPSVNNFVYMGINEAVKNKIYVDFTSPSISYLHFTYDLGEVLINKTTVHSLIFQEYESFEDMEYGADPDSDPSKDAVVISQEIERETVTA